MRIKNRTNRAAGWLFLVLLATGGVFYIYFNFEKANSLVNVDIQMDRETALEKAAQLAADFELGPEEYKQAAAFGNDSRFQNFVELEAGGIDAFTQIISEGSYYSYYWSVRHFKEQDASEVVFRFKPNGEIYGFYEKIPESEKGAALDQEEALRVAEHHAIYNWDVDLMPFELVEQSKEEQISGRIDHTFTYERTDKSVGEGKFRVQLVVCGDKLTSVDYSVKIPEDFDRRYSEMRSANDTIQMISTGAIALIYGLLGVILGIFVLIRKRWLIWKPAVLWGIGIAFASVFLLTINSIPFVWFSYDTSSSESNFLLRQLLSGLLSAIGMGSIFAISFMAAEGLGRMAFPKHIQWWKIWSKNSGGSYPVLGQTIGGYLFAIIILAFDVLFYVTTTTHFGWWSPAGTLSDPNILATYLPWLESIAISLQAGFWEEALFRAVPIAGIFILTNSKKSRNFWIILVLIIQTLIFGAGHANYAQQPPYARVIEMVIPFTIMGVIYIYYGILPAVVAHYAVDVFWISLPLWVSSASGIWLDRILVLLFLFTPLFIVLYIRFRNKKWLKISDKEKNAGWIVPEKMEREEEEPAKPEVKKLNVEKWILLLGLAGLVTWVLVKPFKADAPVPELKKAEAVEVAKTELTNRFDLNFEDWAILTSLNDEADIRDIFAWQEGSPEIYAQLLENYLTPPHWEIRLVKTKGKAEDKTEEFIVKVLNEKSVLGVTHIIPENSEGQNLTQEEAQIITDLALENSFPVERENLKEISISPTKQENRTDWEFIYADTTGFPLTQGQGRYLISVAGNEVTDAYSYVYIPEDWIRNYNASASKKSVIKTTSTILIIGAIVFLLVLGIIRWTRKKFNLKIFIVFTVLFAAFYVIESWLSWPNILAGYNTQIPMSNFITSLLISLSVSGIFLSLAYGIFVASTPGWIPVSGKPQKMNLVYSVGLGLFIAGIMAAVQSILPKTEPLWANITTLNGKFPSLLLAVSETPVVIIYCAFAFILFLGIHHYTKSWTTQKGIGIALAFIAGLALAGISFENYSTWLVSGIITAALILFVYFFFIRFHFEWIPLSFGIIPVLNMVSNALLAKNITLSIGVILISIISLLILYRWHQLLLKLSLQKE